MPLRFRFAAHSEIGLIRKNNQDSGFASPRMLVVADGMGGAAAGDLASAAAIDRIRRLDDEDITAEELPERLAGAIDQANDRLADLVVDDHALEGMGTTVSAVMCDGDRYVIGHIGDSRAYLLRDGEFTRLTHDHSWVQSLVDDGRLTEAEAAEHPHRSLLLRVLNGQPNNAADMSELEARPGDRLLVCSDGLCGLVDDDTLASRLVGTNLEAMVADLVDDAHAAGGSDNITIVVADCVDEDVDLAPVVIGAASERDIPARTVPRVDLGDDAADADDRGTRRPKAPRPRAGSTEEDRYAPTEAPPRGRRIGKLLLVLALAAAVLAGLGYGGVAWAKTQYFVAPSGTKVGIYQGINDSVLGQPLHRLVETEDILISDLPRIRRDQVSQGISVDSLAGAHRTTAALAEDAERCREIRAQREKPTPTTTPTPSTATPAAPGPTAPAPGPTAPTPTATAAPTTPAPPPGEDDC